MEKVNEILPYGQRPEVKITGDVSQEKKDIIRARNAQTFRGDHYRRDFSSESKERLAQVEYKKNEREIDYINRANVLINEVMQECGATSFNIIEDNIYFVTEDFFSKKFRNASEGTRGYYLPDIQTIAVKGSPDQNPVQKMATILHEMIHAKEFVSVHATETEYLPQRGGIVRIKPGLTEGGILEKGVGLNEAIVAHLEKKLFGRLFSESSYFEEERNFNKNNEDQIRRVAANIDLSPDDLFVYESDSGREFLSISYPHERQVLDRIMGGVAAVSNMSESDVEKLFYNAYFAGELSSLARIKVFTEKAFGKGAFDTVMKMEPSEDSANETLTFLTERRPLETSQTKIMEKKIPVSSSPYEQLIPNRKKDMKKDPHPGFTEEEMIRNEAWHGVKKEDPKHLASAHSVDDARAGKLMHHIESETAKEASEVKKVSAVEMREAREQEEKGIEAIAQEGFEKRMRGEGSEAIDKMLIEKGIKPWTPEAEEFMQKWDWEQAEQAFKNLAQEREAAVIKANESEPKKKIELQEFQGKYVDGKFKAFGLNPDMFPRDLKEEYETLTYGQRLLVAENLQQLTLGRIQEEADQRYRDDTKQSNLLGKFWKGITKKYQIPKHEKATAIDIKQGGLAYHGELLKQLVDGTKRTGLDVIEGRDGVLEFQYVEAHPLMTEPEKEGVKIFNAIATRYSKIPYEWSLKTATGAQKREYDYVFGQFEKAKEYILKTEQGIIGDKDTLLFVSDMESKIRLNQFLNTHPDAEKQLQSIESESVLKKALGGIVTERGIYVGAGVATKVFATGLLGAVGFPLAAVGMGGWLARERAATTLRERAIAARYGKKDASRDTRVVMGTASTMADKLDTLLKKIESEENEEKRAQLTALLDVRLMHTEGKIRKGAVDFGGRDQRIINQYHLSDALTRASAFLSVRDAELDVAPEAFKKDIERSLQIISQSKNEKISQAQKDYLRKQMIYGAGLGIGAFSAGYYHEEILQGVGNVLDFFVPEANAGTGSATGSIMENYIPKRPMRAPLAASHVAPGVSAEEMGQRSATRAAAEAHAQGVTSRITKIPMPSRPISPLASGVVGGHEIPTGAGGVVAPERVTIPSGAAKAAQEAIPAKELFHESLDIGKRGPEGAFIDKLEGDPELSKRLGISNKDIGKEAHAAWTEFAKKQLKNPDVLTELKSKGYSADAQGYADMMRRIGHGKIALNESGGRLHMSISEDTEYLRARPKITAPVTARVSDDIPTGPQVFGEAPAVTEASTAIAEERITEQPIIEEIPDSKGDAAETIRRQPVEGILASSDTIPRPSVEVFVDDQFGLNHEEYAAIKEVKVEKLLKQIPSRDEGWAIWRGEAHGKEITLPHDGAYGAMEFKKHLDLAEHIRGLNPDDAAMQGDVDTFMKAEIQSKIPAVSDVPASVEHVASPIAEAQPAPAVSSVEDIPTGPQVFGDTPVVESSAPAATVEQSASPSVEEVPTPGLLAPEKLALLNDDIYNSKVPLQKIITQYKVGNITAEDFQNFYSQKVAGVGSSPQLIEGMRTTLERASGKGGTPQEQLMAKRALELIIGRLRGIK